SSFLPVTGLLPTAGPGPRRRPSSIPAREPGPPADARRKAFPLDTEGTISLIGTPTGARLGGDGGRDAPDGRTHRGFEVEMPLKQSELVEVKQVRGKGRGVFARRPIREGDVIERVPVLVLPTAALEDEAGWDGLASY